MSLLAFFICLWLYSLMRQWLDSVKDIWKQEDKNRVKKFSESFSYSLESVYALLGIDFAKEVELTDAQIRTENELYRHSIETQIDTSVSLEMKWEMLRHHERLDIPDTERAAFVTRLYELCDTFSMPGIQPNYLMHLFSVEAVYSRGGEICPNARSRHTRATGLIQFMPETAIGLGTTVDELFLMSATQQLEYVEKFLAPYAKYINSPSDLYLAIAYPKALKKGWSDDHVISRKGSSLYEQNPAWQDGDTVTVASIRDYYMKDFQEDVYA